MNVILNVVSYLGLSSIQTKKWKLVYAFTNLTQLFEAVLVFICQRNFFFVLFYLLFPEGISISAKI